MPAIWPLADLTQGSAIQSLLQTANAIASGSIPAADLTALTADMLAAVANAIAALNSIIETSTDVTQIQKVRGRHAGKVGSTRWVAGSFRVSGAQHI